MQPSKRRARLGKKKGKKHRKNALKWQEFSLKKHYRWNVFVFVRCYFYTRHVFLLLILLIRKPLVHIGLCVVGTSSLMFFRANMCCFSVMSSLLSLSFTRFSILKIPSGIRWLICVIFVIFIIFSLFFCRCHSIFMLKPCYYLRFGFARAISLRVNDNACTTPFFLLLLRQILFG